jgi:hypothetical protein
MHKSVLLVEYKCVADKTWQTAAFRLPSDRSACIPRAAVNVSRAGRCRIGSTQPETGSTPCALSRHREARRSLRPAGNGDALRVSIRPGRDWPLAPAGSSTRTEGRYSEIPQRRIPRSRGEAGRFRNSQAGAPQNRAELTGFGPPRQCGVRHLRIMEGVVRLPWLEHGTYGLGNRCSILLSYRRTL